MKNSFNKTHAIILLIMSMSLTLVGCGTGADSAGMDSSVTIVK